MVTRTLGQLRSTQFDSGTWAYYFGDCYDKTNDEFSIGQNGKNPPKPFGVRCLYDMGMIDNHKVFYCPGHIDAKNAGHNFDPDFYTHPTTGQWVLPVDANPGYKDKNRIYISYWFLRPMVNGKTPRKLVNFNSSPIYFDMFETWGGLSHKGSGGQPKGINVLYGDAHAELLNKWEFFDYDYLYGLYNEDPWNRVDPDNWDDGPGGDRFVNFLRLYMIMQDKDPLACATYSDYWTAYDNWAHFYK